MQGVFLQAGRDMVIQKFGSKFWKKVSSAGHLPEDFEPLRPYDEEAMFSLTRELSRILGFSSNKTLLEAVGYWFVRYSKTTDHGKAFSFLGPKFVDALRNLNQITSINGTGLQSSLLPNIRCSVEGEGSARLQISGKENRKQAIPFVIGLLKGIAEEMYGVSSLSITQERERDPNKESRIGSESNCDEFRVVWSGEASQSSSASSSPSKDSPVNGTAPGTPSSESPPASLKLSKRDSHPSLTIGIPPAQLATLFPFHFIFNRHMEMIQYGPSLAKMLGGVGYLGKKVSPLFSVLEPSQTSDWNFQDAESWCADPVSFRFTVERARSGDEISKNNSTVSVTLRGQLLAYRSSRTDHTVIGFFGSPLIRGTDIATALNLHLADFALHDTAKEGLFATSTSSSSNDSPQLSRTMTGAGTEKMSKKKDRTLRVEPKELREKVNSAAGVLRSLLGSKYDDTVYENTPSGSAVNGTQRLEASRVEALLTETEIASARRGSTQSTTSSSSGPSAGSTPSVFSLVENLSDSQSAGASNARISTAFQELLIQDTWHRFHITTAILRTALERSGPKDTEEVFHGVVRFCGYRNRLMDLLNTVLDEELATALAGTANSGVFLRTDSIATKTMSAVVELFDENAQYLRTCLAPLLSLETPPEDSSKILKLAQTVVETVCKSAAQCPPMLRNALTLVREKAARSIPEMAIAGVVNVLFLRYINPALVNPERYKLVSKRLSLTQQKVGLQVAKQIQSLVNAAMSDKFTPVPDTLVTQANKDLFLRFLSELTADSILLTSPVSTIGDPSWLESPFVVLNAYSTIRDFMVRHTAELLVAAQSNDNAGASLRNGLQQFMTVCLMEVQTKRP